MRFTCADPAPRPACPVRPASVVEDLGDAVGYLALGKPSVRRRCSRRCGRLPALPGRRRPSLSPVPGGPSPRSARACRGSPRPGRIACPGRRWPPPFLAGPPRPARNGDRGSPPRCGRSPALPGRSRPSPRRSRQVVPTTFRHPPRLPAATGSGTCHEQASDLVHRPRDVSPCFVPRRSDAPNGTPLRDFPEVFSRRSLRHSRPSAVETSGPRPSYADRRNFSSHPSDARERPKVHPAGNSPGSAFRPGRGGPAVPGPGPVLASVASDDSADPRAFRRRFRPGHPGPSRRTPASQPRRTQGRRPSPSPPRRRSREIGSSRFIPSPRERSCWTFG